MKTTKWIKQKEIEISNEIELLEQQIRERNIKETDYVNTIYMHKSGKESTLTIDQMLNILVAKKSLLTEILH